MTVYELQLAHVHENVRTDLSHAGRRTVSTSDRLPNHRVCRGITRSSSFVADKSSSESIRRITLVVMAMLGLNRVANDLVVAVSDGERRRISVAEMFVSGAPVACWDNRYGYQISTCRK